MATPEEVAAAMAEAAAKGPALFGIAVVKAAADVERDAKGRAPYDTGNLISSIRSEPTSAMSAVVYTTAEYGAMVEYGTAPHIIVPKKAKVLAFNGVFTSRVSHPGTAPQPFMEPALAAQMPLLEQACHQIVESLL